MVTLLGLTLWLADYQMKRAERTGLEDAVAPPAPRATAPRPAAGEEGPQLVMPDVAALIDNLQSEAAKQAQQRDPEKLARAGSSR